MTDWQLKIFKGMKMIEEGCDTPTASCFTCPFKSICDIINKKYKDPCNWRLDSISDKEKR